MAVQVKNSTFQMNHLPTTNQLPTTKQQLRDLKELDSSGTLATIPTQQ